MRVGGNSLLILLAVLVLVLLLVVVALIDSTLIVRFLGFTFFLLIIQPH